MKSKPLWPGGALVLTVLALAACCPPLMASATGAGTADGSSETSAESSAEAGRPITLAVATARFDSAWSLVAERYWDVDSLPVDWDEVGERYHAELTSIRYEDELYALLEAMYEEIGDDHSVFVPPSRVAEIRQQFGDLPCVAVFGSSASAPLAPLSPALGSIFASADLLARTELSRLGNVDFGVIDEGAGRVGYLKLPDLASDGTVGALREAIARLEARGVGALVLDLRGNPGGRLVTMMQVAGLFTSGFLWRAVTNWALPLPYPAIGPLASALPLVVLIDGNVHSAAEGLAGALQARGRAVLVGERTAGNVEAILPFCLRDGSQAWIATGVLAPLTGATWEGRGVEPDLAVSADEALTAALEQLAAAGTR